MGLEQRKRQAGRQLNGLCSIFQIMCIFSVCNNKEHEVGPPVDALHEMRVLGR